MQLGRSGSLGQVVDAQRPAQPRLAAVAGGERVDRTARGADRSVGLRVGASTAVRGGLPVALVVAGATTPRRAAAAGAARPGATRAGSPAALTAAGPAVTAALAAARTAAAPLPAARAIASPALTAVGAAATAAGARRVVAPSLGGACRTLVT